MQLFFAGPLDVAHVDTSWRLNHRGRYDSPARRENRVHPLPSPPPRVRRCRAARAADAACTGPHRRNLAGRAVRLRRLRRRYRRVDDDRDNATDPSGAVPDRRRRAPQRHGRTRPDPDRRRAHAGRAADRAHRPRRRALSSAAGRRPDRGQRAVRRAHVAERQRDRGRADDPVERRRCVGGAGGRLHPDRLGHGVPLRPHVPRPAQRPAAAGGLRRGRRHRRRVQRTAHRRLLCLRAGDRHLLSRHLRPGRGRRHRGGLRGQRSRRRTVRSRAPGAHARRGAGLHPHPRPRHGLRPGRHRHHARRDADRGPVPQERRPGLDPPDVRRTRRRCVSLDDAGGTVLRPWRAGRGHRGALHADSM